MQTVHVCDTMVQLQLTEHRNCHEEMITGVCAGPAIRSAEGCNKGLFIVHIHEVQRKQTRFCSLCITMRFKVKVVHQRAE